MISSIAHPTDFSPSSRVAFMHALALALAYRCKLYLLHVGGGGQDAADGFPHIRETLAKWGRLGSDATPEDIETTTGVAVRKVDIRDQNKIEGLSEFLMSREPGLIVAATHTDARQGLTSARSISAAIMRETRTPTLFFGPAFSRPFIDATGTVRLPRVLTPIDSNPNPWASVTILRELMEPFGASVHLTHVGDALPEDLHGAHSQIELLPRQRSIGDSLIEASRTADLVAMPTDPEKSFWERIVGSPTTQVVGAATSPVLLIPAEKI